MSSLGICALDYRRYEKLCCKDSFYLKEQSKIVCRQGIKRLKSKLNDQHDKPQKIFQPIKPIF